MSKTVTASLKGGGMIRIEGVADNIMRCIVTGNDAFQNISSLEILPEYGTELTSSESDRTLLVSGGRIGAEIRLEDGVCVWRDNKKQIVLAEETGKELTRIPLMKYSTNGEEPIIRRVKTVDGERNFVENLQPSVDHEAWRAKISFRWQEDEQIHGLGQGEEGIYNYRGHVQYLYQHNMRIPIPFFVSSQGYGILFDCGCLMTFNDDERGSYLYLDTVEQLDYYVIAGDSMDEIVAGFRKLTGRAAMLPKWAFGYVQSKERYETQEELTAVAEEYRRRGVGLDCVVQDWKTWEADDWGSKRVDRTRYPDLPRMRERMKELHVHTMVSVWPNMNFDTPDCREMRESGHLLHDLATYDAFDEEARAIYWKQCNQELFSGGFDSWWCDSTEPFSGPDWGGAHMREPWERYELVGSEHKKFLGAERANLYAAAHAKGIFENQRKADPDKRVLNLTRSGYPSIQKYGTMLWSGDIKASWSTLKKQITEGLNMGLSGMPYWTLDIGAFFTVHRNVAHRGCGCDTDPEMKWFWTGDYEEGVDDLGYRELYVRWIEMGMFLPMFRSHGTDTPREIWQFGKPGEPFYEAIAETIAFRYRLMPYIYSLAGQVWKNDGTMLRSLLFDFPKDPAAAARSDEFMFGRELLICPVTAPMYYEKNSQPLKDTAKEWNCYLPQGCDWYDMRSDERFAGGKTVTVSAELNSIPVFVKAGSIVPMEKQLQYADETVDTPFEIHIWPGADGSFLYYEDDGDGYAYEKGVFNQIPMTWTDRNRTFRIESSAQRFANGLCGRSCRIIVHRVGTAVFTYEGKACTIEIPEKEMR